MSNIFVVMDLTMTTSPWSAKADRGFSQLNLIKISLRSRMGNDLLNQSLVIKLESPEINRFKPEMPSIIGTPLVLGLDGHYLNLEVQVK